MHVGIHVSTYALRLRVDYAFLLKFSSSLLKAYLLLIYYLTGSLLASGKR